jgi:hypothetical protein
MAQVVEYLLCKHKIMSSNTSPTKKEDKEHNPTFVWVHKSIHTDVQKKDGRDIL